MTACAEVIRNRVRAGRAVDEVAACLAPKQFSCWNDDIPWRAEMLAIDMRDPVVQRCFRAWERSQAGSEIARGATGYVNEAVVLAERGAFPFWCRDPHDHTTINEALVTVRIDRHTFLKV